MGLNPMILRQSWPSRPTQLPALPSPQLPRERFSPYVDTGHCEPSWALSALRPRRTLGTCQLILDPSVSVPREEIPRRSSESVGVQPCAVHMGFAAKRRIGAIVAKTNALPVPLPVPADNYPCSSANAPCSDLKGIVAPARPLIHARDAWRQDFDMIAAGDPPLSGPDSRACRGAQPALPPAYPITTAGAPTRTRP